MTWRPSGLRIGAMRERITVQSPTENQDGYGESIVTWEDLYTEEPASFIHTGGSETMRGRQLEAGIVAVFVVRYRRDYTSRLSIVHQGTRYGIVHVNPVEGGRRYVELMCKASGAVALSPSQIGDMAIGSTFEVG